MKPSWTKVACQWVLVTFCALSLTIPAQALGVLLVRTIGSVQVPDERETETVQAETNESARRVDGRRASRRPPLQVFNHHFRPKAPTKALHLDLRADLSSRYQSLRC